VVVRSVRVSAVAEADASPLCPIANGLIDGTFWIVAAHGTQAGYVCKPIRESG
jgi:hypothetical protein